MRSAKLAARAMKKWERQQITYTRRAEFQAARTKWLTELRCFWTWPFGHVYQRRVSGVGKDCVVCGHVSDPQKWTDY